LTKFHATIRKICGTHCEIVAIATRQYAMEKIPPSALACLAGHVSGAAIFPLLSASSPLKQATGTRELPGTALAS
jgi:hypothetical protein